MEHRFHLFALESQPYSSFIVVEGYDLVVHEFFVCSCLRDITTISMVVASTSTLLRGIDPIGFVSGLKC